MTDDQELRYKALLLANAHLNDTPEQIAERAQAYLAFLDPPVDPIRKRGMPKGTKLNLSPAARLKRAETMRATANANWARQRSIA